ncbi:GntR family transcriptional regulator [Sphingobacterium tabacisoli]|uniref:GntR family transcriptional regulator n=1 Tax=Sphingobacterium tabacisoli TaxID=2044855 RepID=A0ABW5L6R5_9SPHI|nr:GntR family transcriptional regulator [Sphingobacterium tabacisoli]
MSVKTDSTNNPKVKYLQLVNHIQGLIENDDLHIGDRIPSLNQLQNECSMSKETVLKGINYLVEKGIIEAVYRKGYYVKKKDLQHSYRILLLLDKMNIMREQIYQSILTDIREVADIDVFFHHHNNKVFSNIILENLNNYTHFIVVTFLKEDPSSVLNQIPAHKRIIIDYNQENLEGNYSVIYQDFEYDIYNSFVKLQDKIEKYERLVLIAHREAIHAEQVIRGFVKYCNEHSITYVIQSEVVESEFKKHTGYITFSRYDTDDVALIKLTKKNGYILGKDIGLLSYNDTAVKEILEGGISVISTDFEQMGKSVTEVILTKKVMQKRNKTQVIIRNSF